MSIQIETIDLPDESEMSRDDMLQAFVTIVNICKPDHPYRDDPYPIETSNVELSWCSRYWAKCGPRRDYYTASYAVNQSYVNGISTEKHLALLTHEASHITEGRHSSSKSHPKSFWQEMAFNAWQLRENWDRVEASFGTVSKADYIDEVIRDPNSSTVDKRMETVDERRSKQADLLGETYDGT